MLKTSKLEIFRDLNLLMDLLLLCISPQKILERTVTSFQDKLLQLIQNLRNVLQILCN